MGGWFGWWFMMPIFWVVAIFLLVWLIRELFGKQNGSAESKFIEILKERYAKGEISKEEFEAKKTELTK